MGKNKVKKNPGKKGKGRQEVSGEVKENNPYQDVKENTPFELSEMVTTQSEVTVIVGKGVEVLNNNNNVSKEAAREEDCGKEKRKKERINWQPRGRAPAR